MSSVIGFRDTWPFGYRLHRVAYLDAVFVHGSAARGMALYAVGTAGSVAAACAA